MEEVCEFFLLGFRVRRSEENIYVKYYYFSWYWKLNLGLAICVFVYKFYLVLLLRRLGLFFLVIFVLED